MGNTDRGLHFVNILAPFASASESIDGKIFLIDFDRHIFLEFRHRVDARKRRMTAFVRVEGRNSHQTMHPPLRLNVAVSKFAADEYSDRFNPSLVTFLDIDHL